MEAIPVMHGDQFTCMTSWFSKGGQYAVDSCNGQARVVLSETARRMRSDNTGAEYEVPDHYDDAGGAGYYTTMGSIMVKPGCTLYMYSDTGARA